jgi:TP901 family phage tail tape measure protein
MSLNVGELQATLTLDDDMTPALAKAGKSMTDFSGKLDKVGDKTSKLGRDLLPLSAGLIAVGAASLTMAGKFEASMNRLVSIAGVATDELDDVKLAVMNISQETGVGPQALADAMTKVSSTTNNTTKALEILNIAALGTKAGFGDTTVVAGALTAVVNSYAASNLSAARAGDILAQAIKEGGAEASELAPTLANVVPMAAMMGVSFEEVAANLATLTKLGVPTAQAVTQLSSVFSAMSKRTKEGEEALKSVGMSYESLREKVGKDGLQATLKDLNMAFAGNIDGLTAVFGRVEAVRDIMGTAGVQGEEYERVLKAIKESSDGGKSALQEMADAMSGTTTQTWAELTAILERLAITIGNELAPVFQDIVVDAMPMLEWAIDAIKWFGMLPDPIKNVALGFVALGALAAPVLITLSSGIGVVSGALGLMGIGATAAATEMTAVTVASVPAAAGIEAVGVAAGTTWAAIAGPVGLVIAIGALAYAWGAFKGDWTRSFDVLVPPLGLFRGELDKTKLALKTTAEAAKAAAEGKWQDAINILDNFGKVTGPSVRDALGNIPLGLHKAALDLPQALAPIETGLYAIAGAGSVAGDGLDSAKTRADKFQEQLAKTAKEVDNFTEAEKKNIAAGHAHNLQISYMATELNLTEDAVRLYVDRLDESKKASEDAAKESTKFEKSVRSLNNEIGVNAMNAMAKSNQAAKDWIDSIIKARMVSENAEFAAKAMFGEVANSTETLKLWTASMRGAQMQYQEPWRLQDKPDVDPEGWFDGITTELTDVMSKIPDILVKAFTGGGGLTGAFSAIGTMVGSGVGKDLGKKLGESISSIASFAGPMGAAIGALAGPMIEMFAKMLDKTAKGVKSTAKGYGVEIGDAVVEAIKASMKDLDMGQQEATILNADKLFPTVTVENFSDALRIVRDSFSMVATGQFDVAQGAKVIDSMWDKLAAVGTDAFGRINSEMKELITLNKQYGTQSKEITEFLGKQADAAGKAFNAISKGSKDVFDAIKDNEKAWNSVNKEMDTLIEKHAEALEAGTLTAETEKKFQEELAVLRSEGNALIQTSTDLAKAHGGELETLGIIAVATYGAAIEAGKSHFEALQAIQPGMKDLIYAYEQLGLNIDNAALSSLLMSSTILEENPYLLEAIGGLSSSMIALDNMGQLNAATFGKMQETGMTMYTKLQAAVAEHGGAARDALMPMQDYLHQAELQARNLGVPLDANTQMLIDQSKELGLWKDAGKTANEMLLDGIKELNSTMSQLVGHIGGIANGLRGIPSRVESNVIVHHHTEFSESTVSGSNAAGGGLVTSGGVVGSAYLAGGSAGIWEPKGSDTVPAMLTPGERVLTVSENQAYERDAAGGSDPRMLKAIGNLTDAIMSQSETLMIGLRDVLLERG